MKKILVMLILFMTYCLPSFANEQQAVSSFTNFSNKIINDIKTSYANSDFRVRYKETDGVWVKEGKCSLKSSIDIRKTDSLVSPYLGFIILSSNGVKYYSEDNPSGMYSTKESAEQAVLKDLVRDETEKKYIYAYQDEQWVLKSVYWRNPYLNNGMWQEDVKFSPQASFIVNCPVELYF